MQRRAACGRQNKKIKGKRREINAEMEENNLNTGTAPAKKEDILCIVKFFTFSAGLDRLQLAC